MARPVRIRLRYHSPPLARRQMGGLAGFFSGIGIGLASCALAAIHVLPAAPAGHASLASARTAPPAPPAIRQLTASPSPNPAATATSATAVPSPTPAAPVQHDGINTASGACPGADDVTAPLASQQRALTCLVDTARRAYGLQPLAETSSLDRAGTAKAGDLSACGFSHTACGRPFDYWMRNQSYSGGCTGENIAEGQRTAGEVFTAWMASPGHRANILNDSYTGIGIGLLPGDRPIWVQEFGGCR